MEYGFIPDSSITASSEYTRTYAARRGRFNHHTYWRPEDNDENAWIKVNLRGAFNVSGLIAQGARNSQAPDFSSIRYLSTHTGKLEYVNITTQVNITQCIYLSQV